MSAQNPHDVEVDRPARFLSNVTLPPVWIVHLDGRTGQVRHVPIVNGGPCPITVPTTDRAADLYPTTMEA